MSRNSLFPSPEDALLVETVVEVDRVNESTGTPEGIFVVVEGCYHEDGVMTIQSSWEQDSGETVELLDDERELALEALYEEVEGGNEYPDPSEDEDCDVPEGDATCEETED